MRQIPDELAHVLKDKLRGARYVVRHGVRHGARLGQDAAALAPGVPPGMQDFARLAERLLAATERTASALMLRQRHDFEYAGSVLETWEGLRATADDTQRKRLFVRLQYRLIEAVLRHLGAENVFISEHEIALAYEARHLGRQFARQSARPRGLSGREKRAADTVRFWAAAAVALAAREPLREIDLPRAAGPQTRYLAQAAAPFCLLIVALTGAILTRATDTRGPLRDKAAGRHRDDDGLDGTIASAAAVVTARFDRFRAAFVRQGVPEAGSMWARAVETLAEEFRLVLPFLP